MKNGRILFITALMSGWCLSAFCQEPRMPEKVKSITVLEERGDMLIKKQLKESETWFDEKGNIIELIEYKQGKVDKHFKYQFDNDGNKTREEEYDPSGKLKEYSVYKIENGLRTEKIVYEPGGKVILRKVYQYTTY